MACTELPLAFAIMDLIDDSCVDPTAVLAEAAIREAGARIR
jgi:aspartate/glutamate racemase